MMLKFNAEKVNHLINKPVNNDRFQVLIVDDEQANLNIMSSILDEKYEVLRAFDGVEALKIVQELDDTGRLGLVISDQRMPNMTGVELFQRLSAIAPRTIRIIVTGYVDANVIVESVNKAKIYKYIMKPFDRDDFLLTVDRALEAFRMQQQLDKYFRRSVEEKEREIHHQQEVQGLKQKAVTALEESNNLKDDFLRIISHELRTPLNAISGNLSLALADQLNPEVRRYLSIVHNSSEDLLTIIDKILYFTELSANKVTSEKNEVSVKELLGLIVMKYMSLASMKSLTLNLEISAELADTVIMDRQKVSYIIEEMVKNALTFTHKGTVWINVTVEDEGGDENKRLYCQIIDTGPGISEHKQKLIFTAFKQADTSYRREVGGLGIGLSICQQLAGLFDATISLKSELDKGSTFTLSLPYVPVVAEQSAITLQQLDDSVRKINNTGKILVVEDNKVNQLLLCKIIDLLGYQSLKADNGKEAVDCLKDSIVDLIFMDCQMPIMDGFDATTAIRAMENTNSHCPIVAITANAMEQDKKKCLDCGMDEFVKKPINKNIIKEVLKKFIPESISE